MKSEAKPLVALTIGHSTRTIEEFVRLLHAHARTRVVDVRTVPRSRHNENMLAEPLAAYRLASLHTTQDEKVFDCVIVITDRRALDQHLQEAVYQIEHALLEHLLYTQRRQSNHLLNHQRVHVRETHLKQVGVV